MTLQTRPLVELPDSRLVFNQYTDLFVLDASGEKAAFILQVPKSGTITEIGFRTRAVTSSQTIRVSMQTLDASGHPSGTLYGGSAAGTQAAPAANTAYTVALGTAATANQGDKVAIVFEFDSVVGNLVIAAINVGLQFPYGDLFTGSWTKFSFNPTVWLKYNDGTYGAIPLSMPLSAISGGIAFNSGSTPDERAIKFRLPFPSRVMGCWVHLLVISAGADFDVVLYDSDGTTALATLSIDSDHCSGNGKQTLLFAAPVTLLANTYYRLSLKPTTANNISPGHLTVAAAALWDQMAGGQDFHFSSRTNAGGWTDVTTERTTVGLLFDQFDDGAGGGGGSGISRSRLVNA